MTTLLTILYMLIIVFLAIYLYRIVALFIHAQMQKRKDASMPVEADLPTVTVQLPVYNERAVVNDLLDSVSGLDYPHDRLQIQVLDDSTDVTTQMIKQRIEMWKKRGVDIEYVRRMDRRGHKAGNLANALPLARGEFIAIFDADFVPEPAWLRAAVRHFLHPSSERLGLVQTGWRHSNANASLLTYAQNLAVNQFALAQTTRTSMGLWSSFYGSAGLWRKACIEEAGGWSSATFSEDLDIAYRAQLSGWTIGYESAILAAGELPPSMLAYKQQQYFWSKGNIQVSRILWKRLLNVAISPLQRLDAILFSTWPVLYLLFLLCIIVQFLSLVWVPAWVNLLDCIAMVVLSVAFIPTLIDMLRGKFQIPIHLSLGIGMSANITMGLLAGMFGSIGADSRATTPRSADSNTIVTRGVALDSLTVIELGLAVLALIGCMLAFQQGRLWLILVLVSDIQGLAWVGGQSLWEILKLNSHREPGTNANK